MKKIMIVGASGHGKVVADIAKKIGYEEIMFLDDNENLRSCGGYPVIGISDLAMHSSTDTIVAIGNAEIRQCVQEKIVRNQGNIVTLIHPNAVIAEDVKIGLGTVIMAGAVVNSGARIGKGCIINTCSSVDHDCQLGDYVHVSVGAHVAGTVKIGSKTWVGAGATVSNNIVICNDCVIGAGAVVVKNISDAGTYVGVPAKENLMSKHKLMGGYCSTSIIIEEHTLSLQHRRAS